MLTSIRLAVAVAALGAAASVVACGSDDSEAPTDGAPTAAGGPLVGFSRDHDSRLEFKNVVLGVSCQGRGNFVGCDRVCLYAFLRKGDPDYLLAAFAGRNVRLDRVSKTPSAYETCVRREGLLHEGPLAVRADENDRWFGSPPVSVRLGLKAVFKTEKRYVEHHLSNVRLAAGYG